MRDLNDVQISGVVLKKVEKDEEVVLYLECRQDYVNASGDDVAQSYTIPVFTNTSVPVGKTVLISGKVVMRKDPNHDINQLAGIDVDEMYVLENAIADDENHKNRVILSGRIIRIHDLAKGYIMTIANSQDYKADDGWKEKSYFLSVISFSNMRVAEGQCINLQGKVTMREKDGQPVMGLQALSINVYETATVSDGGKRTKPAASESKPARKPSVTPSARTEKAEKPLW